MLHFYQHYYYDTVTIAPVISRNNAVNVIVQGCRGLHWDWGPASPTRPNQIIAGTGGFNFATGGSGRSKKNLQVLEFN